MSDDLYEAACRVASRIKGMLWEELEPLLLEAEAAPILPPDMAEDLEERVAARRQGGNAMMTGSLVTERAAPPGVLPWVGCVRYVETTGSRRVIYDRLGGPPRFGLMMYDAGTERSVTYCEDIRPLADDEALAVAAWLVTGDPAAEWEGCDEGACVLVHDDDVDTALWSCPEGDWAVYATGQENSFAHGHAPTDRERRVAASRAFLTHLCGDAHD